MKHLYFLLIILVFSQRAILAQDTIYDMSDVDFEHIFDEVSNLGNLSTNFLKNKMVDFLSLEKYNGALIDSNYVQEPQLRALFP